MAINPKTSGIHHLLLRCTDMEKTRTFYKDVIGLPVALDTPDIIAFLAGPVIVVFKVADPQNSGGDVFSPFNVGMDHLAMTCDDENELNRVADELDSAGVENTGVKLDELLQKQYVAFKDPDRIQWEFYMA